MRIISFNTEASSAIHARQGGKLRVEVRDGSLFIKPTDRKAGPHVLTELKGKNKAINVEITDKHLEKLGASEILADAASFGMVQDRYGWIALRKDVAEDDKMAIAGATATVSVKEEADAEA